MHHLEPKLKRHTKIACNKPCRQNSVAPPGVKQKKQKTLIMTPKFRIFQAKLNPPANYYPGHSIPVQLDELYFYYGELFLAFMRT